MLMIRTYASAAIVALGLTSTLNTTTNADTQIVNQTNQKHMGHFLNKGTNNISHNNQNINGLNENTSGDVMSTLPTLTLFDIKQEGNIIIVNGQEFKLYNGNTAFKGDGSINSPYLYKAPTLNYNIQNPLSLQSSEQLARNSLASNQYNGLGYYAFGVGVNTGRNVVTLYFESLKSLTWRAYLTDENTLYKISNNTPEFVQRSIDSFNISQRYKIIKPNSYTLIKNPNGSIDRIYKAYNPTFLPPTNAFTIMRGMKFIYQREAAPGFGDGTKEFPLEIYESVFQMNKNPTPEYYKIFNKNMHYRGDGYYSFMNVGMYVSPKMALEGTSVPWNIESAVKIRSQQQFNQYFAAAFGSSLNRMSNIKLSNNFESIGLNIDGRDFITAIETLKGGKSKGPILLYQDGSIRHPYLYGFKNSGHYKINNIITPLAKSASDYTTFLNIIKSQFPLNAPVGLTAPNGSFASRRDEYLARTYYDMQHRIPISHNTLPYWVKVPTLTPQQAFALKANMLSKMARMPAVITKYDKLINGQKFDITHVSGNPFDRKGTKDSPFIAQQGPSGVAYYQFGGTNLMTPVPIDGMELGKYFDALHINQGKEFQITSYPNHFGPTSYITTVNGYKARIYNGSKTLGFGTITEPYRLTKTNVSNFIKGAPKFYMVKSPFGEVHYVNATPITNINDLDKFYFAITHTHLGPLFMIGGKTYTIKVNTIGTGSRVSALLLRQ